MVALILVSLFLLFIKFTIWTWWSLVFLNVHSEWSNWILTGLLWLNYSTQTVTILVCCPCPKPGPAFPSSYSVVFFIMFIVQP
jgi:hypothetical protein